MSDNSNWILSTVYNSQLAAEQKGTWNELARFASIHVPWLITGDLNAVRNPQERKGGSEGARLGPKTHQLNTFITDNNLTDLRCVGSPYTWCNNQGGRARIWAKLDRFLANEHWIDQIPNYQITKLSRAQSDHWPLLLECKELEGKGRRPFRFENHWVENPDCRNSVENIWKVTKFTNPLHDFSHRIHILKKDLIKKCRKPYKGIDAQIKITEEDIEKLENKGCSDQMNQDDWINLRILYNKHQALMRQSTSLWAQRARINWLRNGDNNSKYFHQITRQHRRRNRINQIKTGNNEIITDFEGIEAQFIDFYTNLWRERKSWNPSELLQAFPDDFPSLSEEQQYSLIRPVTKHEIYKTLSSMQPGKSPGPNGMNAEFFKIHWNIIGESVFRAIDHFFYSWYASKQLESNPYMPCSKEGKPPTSARLQAYFTLQCKL
ncbi:hypothetical protein J5N97_002094 [Dioscorea zingiberensis]|uniref:Uncharacterized protein n=1 Tax=Dioscorea zingiberensis TaxID=325984 RepID=A0A9D5D437_9LILI|nr:hypothetical protein J5N97_002094 [Dioscorea zingiberensis]